MLIPLLRTYLRPYLGKVALVVALLVVQAAGNLYLPNLNADVINNGVVRGDLHYIVRTGALMLAITLALGTIAVVAVYWASRTSMGAGADMRAAVFARVQSFSTRDVDRFGTPSLITRNTNDIQQIQLFLQMALTMMVIAPIMCVGGIVLAVRSSSRSSTRRPPHDGATRRDAPGRRGRAGRACPRPARLAFLADPSILILDEATSNVDTRTEILVQKAMARLREGRTSFVIAHRLSTIRGADTIVVMDHGRIVEQGTHAELLAREGAYRALYESQFTEAAAPAA